VITCARFASAPQTQKIKFKLVQAHLKEYLPTVTPAPKKHPVIAARSPTLNGPPKTVLFESTGGSN
jgi:hypothetical protein